MVIIDSDDDLNKECHLMKEAAEESQQILRRARKRRRREMQAIVPAT
jgi:hypothetical protein